MSLYDRLAKISQDVKIQREQMKYEAATNLVSVQPFIRALGYNLNDLSEVYPEYVADPREFGGEAVDYAILRHGVPILVIEAKAAVHSLNEQHWRQLYNYFGALDVQFGVLTNGIEYRFYTDLKKSNVMDKEPFLVIDLLNLDARLVTELEGFSQAGFDPERVVSGAKKRVVARLLKQEMNNPSDEIVRHFAKQLTTRRFTSDELRYYAEPLRDAWQELAKQNHEVKPPPPPPPDSIPVFADYQGRRFTATLMIDDKMWLQRGDNMLFDGKPMNHSVAAFEAVKKVDPLQKKWPTGWIFWRFVDSDTGEEHPIKKVFEDVWTRNSSNGY